MRSRTIQIGLVCRAILLACAVAMLLPGTAVAENFCDPGDPNDFPDVIVGDLHQLRRWGTLGNQTAYSVGTTSCNIGTCELQWISSNNQHPVIGGNMFRYKDGRFEQLGQSWLKHGFFALSEDLCSDNCEPTSGATLGVNCSDPYSSFLNGNQNGLGPKFEVNASTGEYPYPATDLSLTGNALYKRIIVDNDDVDPALNPGASYYMEGQYITRDDALAGKNNNNSSFRQVYVINGNYDLSFTDPATLQTSSTQRERAAIFAWRFSQPSVRLGIVEPDGRVIVASDVMENGDGTWRYEFAVQNVNSHRSVGRFSVPLPFGANLSNIGFHDVHYHSGEPYDGTDWEVTITDGRISWSTQSFDENPDANALRWGTLYNFWFDCDIPPAVANVELGLFRPGDPESILATAKTPAVCDFDGVCDLAEDATNCAADCEDQNGGGGICGDGTCNAGESPCTCFADCGPAPAFEFSCNDGIDGDCDGRPDCADEDCCADLACGGPDSDGDGFELCDCAPGDGDVWAAPGEVEALALGHDVGSGETVLSWLPPVQPGGNALSYSVLRSINPRNFTTSTVCVGSGDPTLPEAIDLDQPVAGEEWYYLIRGDNACAADGKLGQSSYNLERSGRACP